MKLSDFRKFTPTTAQYPVENSFFYLNYGLKSEAGEVLGKVAKLFRGDKTYEGMRPQIANELGDVCWFVSQIAHFYDLRFKPDVKNFSYFEFHVNDPLIIGETANSLFTCCRDLFLQDSVDPTNGKIKDSIVLQYTFEHLLTNIYGLAILIDYDIETIFSMNKEKLTGRVKKGNIKGNGDNR